MREEDAREWVRRSFDVPRETMARLDAFIQLLRDENERQNLVSKASLDHVWTRHIADSAQLLRFAPDPESSWLDLGTGAGFPGLIIAALHAGPVTLVEERRLRTEFLRRSADILGVKPDIIQSKVQRLAPRPFDVISARAFAPLDRLLKLGTAFSTAKTVWILPKGQNAESELESLDRSWQGAFRLEASLTDASGKIIVAEGPCRRKRGKRQ